MVRGDELSPEKIPKPNHAPAHPIEGKISGAPVKLLSELELKQQLEFEEQKLQEEMLLLEEITLEQELLELEQMELDAALKESRKTEHDKQIMDYRSFLNRTVPASSARAPGTLDEPNEVFVSLVVVGSFCLNNQWQPGVAT